MQRIENKVNTAEQKATTAEQASTEVRNKLSQLTDTLRAQHALSELGLYNGAQDGVVGPQTTAAIQKFQANRKLSVTGNLDEATLNALSVQH